MNLTIGKVAGRSGVNVQTVRYYERRGLLAPDGRLDSGYRLYGEDAVKKIRFVKNAQGLGFTLDEIARLLRLKVGRAARCGQVKKQAQARLESVREKIAGLRAIEKTLERLLRTCAAKGTTDSCPILSALSDHGEG